MHVVVQLINSKCIPLLLYGTEAIPLKKAQVKSADYAVTSCFMKLFKTKVKDIVCDCMLLFNFQDFSSRVMRRKRNFLRKFVGNFRLNVLCCIFIDTAKGELNSMR